MRTRLTSILLALILSAFCACKNKTFAKFEITNATDETIDSIKILPDNVQNHYIQLAPNTKAEYIIDMTSSAKTDGNYGLFFKFKNKKLIKHFGYYTNGYPLESLTKLIIYKDSIDIKQEFNKIY